MQLACSWLLKLQQLNNKIRCWFWLQTHPTCLVTIECLFYFKLSFLRLELKRVIPEVKLSYSIFNYRMSVSDKTEIISCRFSHSECFKPRHKPTRNWTAAFDVLVWKVVLKRSQNSTLCFWENSEAICLWYKIPQNVSHCNLESLKNLY